MNRIEELIDRGKLSGSHEAILRHFGGCFMSKIQFYDYFDQQLLPCPFCAAAPARNTNEAFNGGVYVEEKRVPEDRQDYFNPCTTFTVVCRTCRVKLTRGKLGAAVEAWNTRKA